MEQVEQFSQLPNAQDVIIQLEDSSSSSSSPRKKFRESSFTIQMKSNKNSGEINLEERETELNPRTKSLTLEEALNNEEFLEKVKEGKNKRAKRLGSILSQLTEKKENSNLKKGKESPFEEDVLEENIEKKSQNNPSSEEDQEKILNFLDQLQQGNIDKSGLLYFLSNVREGKELANTALTEGPANTNKETAGSVTIQTVIDTGVVALTTYLTSIVNKDGDNAATLYSLIGFGAVTVKFVANWVVTKITQSKTIKKDNSASKLYNLIIKNLAEQENKLPTDQIEVMSRLQELCKKAKKEPLLLN